MKCLTCGSRHEASSPIWRCPCGGLLDLEFEARFPIEEIRKRKPTIWNPFFFHGTKTFAYEVCEQLGWKAPDAVVVPAGNGTLLLGALLGFTDLLKAGVIARVPRLVAVQAAACAPVARAFAGDGV